MSEKQTPLVNARTATVAAGIGGAVSMAVVANNPEFQPFAILIVAAVTGILGGLGNHARTIGGWPKAIFGWLV